MRILSSVGRPGPARFGFFLGFDAVPRAFHVPRGSIARPWSAEDMRMAFLIILVVMALDHVAERKRIQLFRHAGMKNTTWQQGDRRARRANHQGRRARWRRWTSIGFPRWCRGQWSQRSCSRFPMGSRFPGCPPGLAMISEQA